MCIGAAAFLIGVIRRRIGGRVFLLLGLWSATYGAMQMSQQPTLLSVSPHWFQICAPYANTAMTYLIVVVGALCFRELSRGGVRFAMQIIALLGLTIAVGGVWLYVRTGRPDKLMGINNLLAACLLIELTAVVASPTLSKKYLVFADRGILATGTLLFALEALFVNLSRPLGFNSPRIFDHLGFAVLLSSFGYGGLQLVLSNERRLMSIEHELIIAREIQTSILPEHLPASENLRVAAIYRPMTSVAGDFYEFLATDAERQGFLVADVSGHGVPAALIASMIKIAVQMVEPCANDPSAVLRGLNRALAGQLRGQLVSAGYLWLDTAGSKGLYSAAGHPPLLRWHNGTLESIVSNGLLFGVNPECNDYPACTFPIEPGDRFLLYTDGVTEPENAEGQSFGDFRLEQVMRENRGHSPAQLSERILSELQNWQPASLIQQDDITVIVIDVL